MKTPNESFNISWKYLQAYHQTAFIQYPQDASLDLSTQPKLDKHEWKKYISHLLNLVIIGSRNGYLYFHVSGSGDIAYLLVHENYR